MTLHHQNRHHGFFADTKDKIGILILITVSVPYLVNIIQL
jgi:hypothetical protein